MEIRQRWKRCMTKEPIPKFSTIAEPLNALKSNGAVFQWMDECQRAFQCLKDHLTSPPYGLWKLLAVQCFGLNLKIFWTYFSGFRSGWGDWILINEAAWGIPLPANNSVKTSICEALREVVNGTQVGLTLILNLSMTHCRLHISIFTFYVIGDL